MHNSSLSHSLSLYLYSILGTWRYGWCADHFITVHHLHGRGDSHNPTRAIPRWCHERCRHVSGFEDTHSGCGKWTRGRDKMSLVFLKAFLYERIVYSFVLLGRATAPSAIILSFALTIYFITEMQSFLVNSSLQFIIDCYVSIILSIYLSINLSIYLFFLSLSHAHALT